MPIKPERKHLYPANWSTEIVPAIRARSGNRCELCSVPNYELGGRGPTGKWHKAWPLGEKLLGYEWPEPGDWARCDGYDMPLLTTMHLNHKEEDCRLENLKHACQQCHLRYDAEHHRRNAEATRRAKLNMDDLFTEDGDAKSIRGRNAPD